MFHETSPRIQIYTQSQQTSLTPTKLPARDLVKFVEFKLENNF